MVSCGNSITRLIGLHPIPYRYNLTANLMTALLVLVASRLGLPVSTTHVSCGSIFGIGLVNRKRRWGTIGKILATWVTTLPLGLGLGALLYAITQSFGSVS